MKKLINKIGNIFTWIVLILYALVLGGIIGYIIYFILTGGLIYG